MPRGGTLLYQRTWIRLEAELQPVLDLSPAVFARLRRVAERARVERGILDGNGLREACRPGSRGILELGQGSCIWSVEVQPHIESTGLVLRVVEQVEEVELELHPHPLSDFEVLA